MHRHTADLARHAGDRETRDEGDEDVVGKGCRVRGGGGEGRGVAGPGWLAVVGVVAPVLGPALVPATALPVPPAGLGALWLFARACVAVDLQGRVGGEGKGRAASRARHNEQRCQGKDRGRVQRLLLVSEFACVLIMGTLLTVYRGFGNGTSLMALRWYEVCRASTARMEPATVKYCLLVMRGAPPR